MQRVGQSGAGRGVAAGRPALGGGTAVQDSLRGWPGLPGGAQRLTG